MKNNQNPKIYYEIESILHSLLKIHKKIDKTNRIVILEKEIYSRLTDIMKKILMIGIYKKDLPVQEINQAINDINIDLKLIISFLSFLLLQNKIKEGFYYDLLKRIDNAGKQLQGWKRYLQKKHPQSEDE